MTGSIIESHRKPITSMFTLPQHWCHYIEASVDSVKNQFKGKLTPAPATTHSQYTRAIPSPPPNCTVLLFWCSWSHGPESESSGLPCVANSPRRYRKVWQGVGWTRYPKKLTHPEASSSWPNKACWNFISNFKIPSKSSLLYHNQLPFKKFWSITRSSLKFVQPFTILLHCLANHHTHITDRRHETGRMALLRHHTHSNLWPLFHNSQ